MKTKESKVMAKKLTELTIRTYYTYRDETRDTGTVAVGSHAFSVLAKVYYSNKEYCVNDLSEMMHMQSPQLSKLLTLLENAGYVTKRRPENNRRSVLVNITEEGKAYFEKMYAVIESRIIDAVENASIDDPAAVAKAMELLYKAMYN